MEYERITTEKKGNVFLMGLNRPDKYNAFDIDMYVELAYAYKELDADPELRCGLLFAHGKNFTSGLELDKWAPVMANEGIDVPDGAIHPLGLDEDKRVTKPVVMAIQGRCYTIGFELLLAQDIRVAAKDARIALLEVTRGLYPVGGGTVRLFEEIGWGNAMRYLLTGDEISGEEAYRLGLVQDAVEPGTEFDRAFEIAEKIAKAAPLGVMAALRSSRISRIEGAKAALARLIPDLKPVLASEDMREGIASFLERRKAEFKGK